VVVLEIPCGPNIIECAQATDYNAPDGEHTWWATAYDTEGFESVPSETQTATVDSDTGIYDLRLI